MSPESHKVSVIIAVKDGARYLLAAIDSVFAQDHPALELIVVDGGSTDGSREIALSCDGVRVLGQNGSGLADAWNTGIAAASGDYVAFLDSDDAWEPDVMTDRVRALSGDPGARMQTGRVRFFLEPGHRLPPGFKPELMDADRVAPIPGTLLAERALFDDVGGFDTRLKIAADVDWFARAKDAGVPTSVFDRLVLHKRIHGGNLAGDAKVNNTELLSLLRASLARQANAG